MYGSDPGLRAALEAWRWPYVLGVRSTQPVRLAAHGGWSEQPAGAVAATRPATAWRRISAGEGTKGPRRFDWAAGPRTATTGHHTLLVRRALTDSDDDPDDTALFLVFHTRPTTLAEMVAAAGWRWSIEVGFEAAKGEVGLDHYEVRQTRCANGTPGTGISPWPWWPMPSWPCSGRGLPRRQAGTPGYCLIPLTLPEIRRLICPAVLTVVQTLEQILRWSLWRRWHQAVAKACHSRRQRAALGKMRL